MQKSRFRKLSVVLSTHQTNFDAIAFRGDFEANIAKIADMGYDGVELAIRDPGLINQEGLITVLNKYGLQVPAIGTGQAWSEEKLSLTDPDPHTRRAAVERINRHIEFANKFNSIVIIGLIRGMTPPGQTKLQALQHLREGILECLDYASRLNVCLALEPINRYETDLINSVGEGCDLVRQIGSPRFGLLLDTFHMNIEEPVIEESIQSAKGNIFHFHVADSNRWYPGAGHINFKGVLQALLTVGYQGWISGEFLPKPDPNSAAIFNISYLGKIHNEIMISQ